MTSHFLQALAFVCLFSFIFGHHISLYVMHQQYQTAYVCLKVPRHFIPSLLYHCGVFLCLKSLLLSICLVIFHSSCFQKFLLWFFSPQDIRTELMTVWSLCPLYLLLMLPILIFFYLWMYSPPVDWKLLEDRASVLFISFTSTRRTLQYMLIVEVTLIKVLILQTALLWFCFSVSSLQKLGSEGINF